MYSVLINGFRTKDEAEEFIRWYEGQGEQMDICVWMECRKQEGKDVRTFLPTDCADTYPIEWKEAPEIPNPTAILNLKE